jgi:DNA-binding transcriptional regulator YdaS (Cro superfamily)
MQLLDYIKNAENKSALALSVGVSKGYLWQIATGWVNGKGYKQKAAPTLAVAIERSTGGIVSCEETRPDLEWVRGTTTGDPIAYEVKIDSGSIYPR